MNACVPPQSSGGAARCAAARRWLDARKADLLPVEYYHVVFTLPAPIADIAYQSASQLGGQIHRCLRISVGH